MQWWVPVWANGGDILTKDRKKSALADPARTLAREAAPPADSAALLAIAGETG